MRTEKIPYNIDAETNLIASILIDPSIVGEVLNRIQPSNFYIKANVNIMQAIVNLYDNNQVIDYVKVIDELQRLDLLEAIGGNNYLFNIIENVPSIVNVNAYVEIIEEKALMRELYYATQAIQSKVLEGNLSFSQLGEEAELKIMHVVEKRKTGDIKKIHRFTDYVLDIIESNKNRDGKLTGLDTGFEDLNRLTFGFQKGELIILAARPGIGKSAFALNIAANACKNVNANVAFFSLEMGIDQLLMRLFSSFSGLSLTKIRSGKLNTPEMTTLLAAKTAVDKLNIYLDDSNHSLLSDIKAKCLKLKREDKLDLIIVDYLQLVTVSNSRGNRVEEVGKISRGLKTMARELEVPVLALSQLSRSVEQAEKPMLSHLRESGSIEQDADIVMFLHRDKVDEDSTKQVRNHKTEVIVAKNRQGSTDSFNMIFKGAQSTFSPIQSN